MGESGHAPLRDRGGARDGRCRCAGPRSGMGSDLVERRLLKADRECRKTACRLTARASEASTQLESSPPDRNTPSGTSLISRRRAACCSSAHTPRQGGARRHRRATSLAQARTANMALTTSAAPSQYRNAANGHRAASPCLQASRAAPADSHRRRTSASDAASIERGTAGGRPAPSSSLAKANSPGRAQ